MLSNIKFSNLFSELILLVVLLLTLTLVGCQSDPVPAALDTVAQEETTPTTPVALAEEPEPEPVVEPEPEVVPAPEPEPVQEVTFDFAEEAYHAGDYAEATERFTIYTEEHAANPWGFYMLGLSSWKDGDLGDAESAFIEAIRLDPTHVKSWINLTRVHLENGKSSDAIAALNEAIAYGVETSETYRLQGRAYDQQGDHTEAVAAYREALMLDQKDAWSMNNLGLVYIKQEQFDDAVSVLAVAVEERTDIALFYNNLGMALEHVGQFRAAEEAYQAAIDLNETYEKAIANLERVETVDQDPLLEPVDLAVIADRFVEEMATWSQEDIANESMEVEAVPEAVEDNTDVSTLPEIDSLLDVATTYTPQADSTQNNP